MSDLLERWRDRWEERNGSAMLLATHPTTDDLYRWERGAWRNLTPRFARVLMTETSLSPSRHSVEAALFAETNMAPYLDGDRHGLDSPTPWINFRNGVYDLSSGELREHRDPWNTIHQIPHDYRDDLDDLDLDLDTMPLDVYLRERVAEDIGDAGVMWQLIGAAMLPGNPSQMFAILQGPGGSGKGTYLSLLADVIGPENVSTLSLGQLADRFASADLNGVLSNVAGDVVGGVVPAYELILEITGGDAIRADRKYRTPITFVWDGLLILATNGRLILPSGAGSESGWWRRAVYIDMPHAVASGDRISANELRGRIAPDLSTVATKAARAVADAWRDGHIPTVTGSMARSSADARTSGDTVADWAADRLAHDAGSELLGTDAYRDYTAWCAYFGHRGKGHAAFYGDLTNMLIRKGWGQRADVRRSSSKALFTGARLEPVPIWQSQSTP